MSLSTEQIAVFEEAAKVYPLPIAVACNRFWEQFPDDLWAEWSRLSRDVLQPILQYLSHVLLSDLAATGRQPAHLFHRIESILSRATAGQYAGFLRETARYYREQDLPSAVPEMISFLLASEVDCSLIAENRPLVGLLVDYRNLWAHGRFDNPIALQETVSTVRELTVKLLSTLRFLTVYPLQLEDGTSLMGCEVAAVRPESQPLVVIAAGGLSLRPLLLKLKGRDVMLLEDCDLPGRRLAYRGSLTYTTLTRRDLSRGDGERIFEDLKALIAKVRAIEAMLPLPERETFRERTRVITERTLSSYQEMRKYVSEWYVSRPEWEGKNGLFELFLRSNRTLLALSGSEGTGKSALVTRLAEQAYHEGHMAMLVNAQRFSFAEVTWSGNPYPSYFAGLLHYEHPFDRSAFAHLIKTIEPGKQVILFIDGINEVDGIEVRWNRFRAMELLLEWIVGIAQPRLKIVLSFRVDVYEEFGYLQTDELPPTLTDIAYPGSHPGKSWVKDLELFSEEQAAALYDKLQKQPQYGMAPAMAWEKLKQILGSNLETFAHNPLIFMVLLRSHHQESKLAAIASESLFQWYANKLTAATQLERPTAWQKIWGFLKHANLTPKQLLLSRLVTKMTDQGSSSILVYPSTSNKKRSDRRVDLLLTDPRTQDLQDFKEAGFLTYETIDHVSGAELGMVRRITFVSDLLTVSMDQIGRRISLLWRFRLCLIAFAIIGFALPLLSLVFRLTGLALSYEFWLDPYNIMPAIHPLILHATVADTIFCLLLAFVFTFSIICSFLDKRSKPYSASTVGLLESGVLNQHSRFRMRQLIRVQIFSLLLVVILLMAIFILIMLLFISKPRIQSLLIIFAVGTLLGYLLFCIASALSPCMRSMLIRLVTPVDRSPSRLVAVSYAKAAAIARRMPAFLFDATMVMRVASVIPLFIFSYICSHWPQQPEKSFVDISSNPMAQTIVHSYEVEAPFLIHDVYPMLATLSGILLLASLLLIPIDVISARRSYGEIARNPGVLARGSTFINVLKIVMAWMLAGGLAMAIIQLIVGR